MDKRYETKTERPLDPCFIETERPGRALPAAPPGEKPPKEHVIRASRLIVLGQNDPNARVENSVSVAEGEHLLVYGDRVRVAGRIELRGLDVTINCRELEFVANSKGTPPEIDVTGVDGADPGPGLNALAPQQAAQGTKEDRKGKNGNPGADGDKVAKGNPGGKGGKIFITCHTLSQLTPVTLRANGGKGGAGVRGQDGQRGGDGLDGAGGWDGGKEARSAKGGQGGNGGNGGEGGQGGEGGKILLYCLDMPPSSYPVTLSVAGGSGGQGGDAGNGGNGGKGATPSDGASNVDYKRLYDGADSGGGGAAGIAGYGGGCGNPGTITVRSGTVEALRYPAKKFLRDRTATLSLICKSGTFGENGKSAKPGMPGEPGNAAKDPKLRTLGPDGTPIIIPPPEPGHAGNKGTTTPPLPPRTAPVRQGPVERMWEVWQGEPPAPLPTPPALPTAPIPSGPQPQLPTPRNLEIYLKEPQRYRLQLLAAQKENELRLQQYNEERKLWNLEQNKYEEEQRKYREAQRSYEQENSKYSELIRRLNAEHPTWLAKSLEGIWDVYATQSRSMNTCMFATDGTGDITVASTHGLSAGAQVRFSTTGALPGELDVNSWYYVLSPGLTATKLRIALTAGGTVITFATAGIGTHACKPELTCTFAADGTGDIIVASTHGLLAGAEVRFSTTGALPGELDANSWYHVLSSDLTTTKLRIALTAGGTAITFKAAGTGTHTCKPEAWKPVELKDIGAKQDIEQLQMLYDYARTRYLLAPNGRATAVPYLPEQVAWLVDAAHAKLDRKKVKIGDKEQEEVLNTPADVFHLWQAASSTNRNLWLGNNLFGHDARYAVLGDPKKHAKALQDMRTNLKDIEDSYQQNVRFLNLARSWAANWSQVKQAAQGVKNDMEGKQTAIKEKLDEVLPAIEQKESFRKELFDKLKDESQGFATEIQGKVGLTPQDFFGMLNQLSFTNREFHNQAGQFLTGGAVAAGAMLVSQAGELMAKAMDNVVTDTGESVNKKYIIRAVKTLTAKLPTIENLKQERSGLISQDPNAEVRLLATREQLNSILENFYEQSAKAREISQTLDAYVDAVQARNATVDEWNQLLALYAYCGAESEKAEAQSAEVEKTKSNDPGLVAMARFSTALTRHALEDYIKRLYEAGRVCSLRTLRKFDPFASLSEIASESNADIGFLNSDILAKAVNDYIGAVLSSTTTISDLSDMPPIELTLTPKTHPVVFALLRKGKASSFQIPAPDPRAVQPGAKPPADPEEPTRQSNLFALKADVRLTHIKPHVFLEKDNELSSLCSRYTIQLSHSGKETFYRDDGLRVLLNHDPMEKSFEYSEGSGNPDKGKLSSEHSGMIGPFCSWEISIPENGIVYKPGIKEQDKNLEKIQSIRIVFEGKCRGFTPAAIETAKKEARAIVTDVTDKTFQELVLTSEKPIIVDFWSNESGSSPALEAMRKAVKGSYAGQIRFAKCNVDDNKETYERYKAKITKLPSLLLFRGGDLLQVADGSLPADQIRSILRNVMGQPSAEL